MKLNEVKKLSTKPKSEKQQILCVTQNITAIKRFPNASDTVRLAAVTKNGWAIEYIENPSEAVQLAAVNQSPWSVTYITHPTQSVIKTALTQAVSNQYLYNRIVKRVFKDNNLLMKKWLRYGETMRDQE